MIHHISWILDKRDLLIILCVRFQAAASRSETWSALEEARVAGKCRFIGVSNYSVPLLAEMETYAKV